MGKSFVKKHHKVAVQAREGLNYFRRVTYDSPKINFPATKQMNNVSNVIRRYQGSEVTYGREILSGGSGGASERAPAGRVGFIPNGGTFENVFNGTRLRRVSGIGLGRSRPH